MDFIAKVLDFFFKGGVEQHLIFGAASAVVGVLIVTLDWIYYFIKRKSFLNLTYDSRRSILVFLLWGVGAGLVGLIGGAFNVFQENLQACVSVGIGWPSITPRLIECSTMNEDTQPGTRAEE